MSSWPISDALRSYLEVQYELMRVLGSGGMGSVLLARERALERLVAIKVLHPASAADDASRERFRREARTAAKLTHPNIVPLHTFGEVHGELYFVMGYVDGETLGARLARDGRLSADETGRILGELADALEYAHHSGTVHRDLKPDNILVDAQTGRAMLTDFGIARDIGTAGSLTSTGMIVGTPHYMSPEQASGERTIDGRSDLYALGVIGYRALSGTLPFGGSSAREVIARQVAAEAPPMAEAVRDESPALVAAISRAMAKAPDARWATAAAFASAVRATGEDDVLGDELAEWDGIATRITTLGVIGSALFPLASLVGVSELAFGQSLLAFAATAGISALVSTVGARIASLRGDRQTRELRWRVSLRPPRWWVTWWPRRFRRPGDVWDRLPREMRAIGWINAISSLVIVPIQAGAVIWALTPAGTETFGRIIVENPQWITRGIAIALGATLAGIAALNFLSRTLRKRFGIDRAFQRNLVTLSVADPRWTQPRFAALLERAPATVVDVGRSTDQLLADLRRSGVPLPDGLVEARDAARRARDVLDRERRALREMVNAEEIVRINARIAALGTADTQLRAMLESQRELLERAEARLSELGALQGRLDAQESLLHQQLIALRDLAPSGGDLSEVTGRLRAVRADIARLAEGFAEVNAATTPRTPTQ